ncbi:MAG: hypothetical protein GY792_02045, partial [Gammaproteobacteria bacterium]|nr:hypothetical protein [Gammaproteobacteria bacterium]
AFGSDTTAAPLQQAPPVQTTPLSCRRPAGHEQKTTCDRLEQQILAVTIRIEMHTWVTFGGHNKPITTESHATILDGKYLVTHNHFKYSLTEQVLEYGEQKGYTGVSIRTTGGNLLLENAPLASFSIVHEEPETLVLAFVDENGTGLFERHGLSSAQFAAWGSISWQPGMELAQIDWDGDTAHVDWVLVENLGLDNNSPQIQVNNFPKKGCSGGGIFWNGTHVGNNWAKNIEENPNTGEIV